VSIAADGTIGVAASGGRKAATTQVVGPQLASAGAVADRVPPPLRPPAVAFSCGIPSSG
jgi:hypothetical protein